MTTKATEPLTPDAIEKQRHDIGQTITLGLADAAECLQLYKMMGPSRSMAKVRTYLKNQGRKQPAEATLKNWSAKFNWKFHVEVYDREVMAKADAISQAEYAKVVAEDIHTIATRYRSAATKIIKRVDEKIQHLKLADGSQVRAAVEAAVALTKAAEVLDGGVSDRTENRSVMSVEERKSAAERLVDEAFSKGSFSGQQDNGTRQRENQYTKPRVENAADDVGGDSGIPGDDVVGSDTGTGSGESHTAKAG